MLKDELMFQVYRNCETVLCFSLLVCKNGIRLNNNSDWIDYLDNDQNNIREKMQENQSIQVKTEKFRNLFEIHSNIIVPSFNFN